MNYQETGNKIPVTVQELIGYVQKKLSEYDQLNLLKVSSYGNIDSLLLNQKPTPYKDYIIYMTREGKLIKIPEQIQNMAIDLWNNNQKMQSPGNIYNNNYYAEYPSETSNLNYESENLRNNLINDNSNTNINGSLFSWSSCSIFLIILFIIGCILFSYNPKLIQHIDVSSEKFFLTR